LKTLFNILSSMKLTVILLFIFAVSIGSATFIENDYGTETALAEVYRANWFELLLFTLSLNLISSFFRYKMHHFKKWYVSLFHLSFIIIAIGAYLTRYYGFEGMMHIREGSSSNSITSEKSYIDISIDNKLVSSTPKLFSNLSRNTFHFSNGDVEITLKDYIPYASYQNVKAENGKGISKVSLVVSIDEGLKPIKTDLTNGNFYDFGFTVLDFDSNYTNSSSFPKKVIKLHRDGDRLIFSSDNNISGFSMDTRTSTTFGKETEAKSRILYQVDGISIVFKDIQVGVETKLISNMDKPKNMRENFNSAFIFDIKVGDKSDEVTVFGKRGAVGQPSTVEVGGKKISISYGSKPIHLPFSIYLRDFQLERYAGSMSPSSYASEVTLIDKENNISMDYRIYMNHVLDYKGYRFFQSSYDMDERGTILSVNYDWLGTTVTYIGYFIMFTTMFISLFGKKSRFQKLKRDLIKFSSFAIFTLLVASSNSLYADKIEIESIDTIFKFDKAHSDRFGTLLVQDSGGRMKPLDSLNMEIVNKIHRSDTIEGLDYNQIVLGMILRPNLWKQINMIYTNDKKVNKILGLPENQKYASFQDFFEDPVTLEGYKLASYIETASRVPMKNRGKFEKALVKIDERVNVAYMTYSGTILRIFPKPNDKNHKWVGAIEALQTFDPAFAKEVQISAVGYFQAVDLSLKSGDWSYADKGLLGIKNFQEKYGSDVYIDNMKIAGEILYNKIQIFKNLIPYTLLIGFGLLAIGFIRLFRGRDSFKKTTAILKSGVAIILVLYSGGLMLRWYISGHAPWSDAYESLVYIGWASLLAGFIFSKSSPFIVGSTTILTGIILFVAHLSWLDPQITNLVPVLKSYWLTIHVSLITASYGFLGLGALLGFITLILFIIKNSKNRETIENRIRELNIVNEMSLIIGLLMLTVGNFLGGVWANESWGRYWGWDSKETWALVTILIYAIVIHLRFIPKFNSGYTFALSSLLAFSSVLMTYFGVNFYLSGMHSYAQGDPVPIPAFVYYMIATVFIISILAYRKRECLKSD